MQLRRLYASLLFGCLISLAHGVRDDDGSEGTCPVGDPSCGPAAVEDGIALDIKQLCPLVDSSLTSTALWVFKKITEQTGFLQHLSLWPQGNDPSSWSDDYTSAAYLMVVRLSLGLYKTRDASWVKIPTRMSDPSEVVHVERIYAPHWDVDGTPNFMWFEGIVPEFAMKDVYAPGLTCFQSLLRRLATDTGLLNGTFDDSLDDPVFNRWETVLAGSPYKSKLDWTMAFYDIAHAWDGTSLWPAQMTNFQTYWKQDEYDDKLEYAISFHLIGAHRVESGSWKFDNLPGIGSLELPFRVPTNAFAAFPIRKNFGRYGADLYFNEEGLPVLIQTPDGEIVLRGDKKWQYWKFVWRSTLITGITLVDHLHFTHFRASNILARLSRASMQPNSPMRRMTSIFTFGAIFVNLQAMHTLIGPNHMLHRATPFTNFAALSDSVPAAQTGLMPDVIDKHGIKVMFDEAQWEKLHPKLKEAPYFADGRLIAKAIRKLFDGVFKASASTLCNADGTSTQMSQDMVDEVINETIQAGYAFNYEVYSKDVPCIQRMDTFRKRVEHYVFTVSAYHKHVGFVGDYYKDPHLASMSWADGEAHGRPKQHIIMTVINVFTSTGQPKLKEDFTHLFKGMEPDLGDEFVRLWREFQRDLQEAEEEIDRRNAKREITNDNMSPRVLEAAVSK